MKHRKGEVRIADLEDEYSSKAAEQAAARGSLPRQEPVRQPTRGQVQDARYSQQLAEAQKKATKFHDRKTLYEVLGPLAEQLGIKVSSITRKKRGDNQ